MQEQEPENYYFFSSQRHHHVQSISQAVSYTYSSFIWHIGFVFKKPTGHVLTCIWQRWLPSAVTLGGKVLQGLIYSRPD